MAGCFFLRFQFQNGACINPPDNALMARMFSETEENIAAGLKEYGDTNKKAVEEIAKSVNIGGLGKKWEGKKILFTGDSITADRMSHAKIFATAFPEITKDCSVSGIRSVDVASNIWIWLNENKPDLTVCQIGTNDMVCTDKEYKNTMVSVDEYERNLRIIVDTVRSFGGRLVLRSIPLMNYEAFNACSPYRASNEETRLDFNKRIMKVCRETGTLYHDIEHVFKEHKGECLWEDDGVHLSPTGQKYVALSFMKFLETLREE